MLGFKCESASLTTGCLHLRKQCVSAMDGCESAWAVIEDVCNVSGHNCTMKESLNCNLSIQLLADRYPAFKDCLCAEDISCSATNFLGRKCIIKTGFKGTRSCLEVTVACVGDTVCNKQLARFLKDCSTHGSLCNMNQCQAAIRFFYQNIPFNIAQMLAFCDCAQSDIPCQQSKEALHSKPCAVNVVPIPSCLNVIRSCRDDELCRQRFETFQSKCWQDMDKCSDDETCIVTLNKENITCSRNEECREAYIGTLGTYLHVQCTCSTLSLTEEYLCKIFHHILHSRSCFNVASKDFAYSNSPEMLAPVSLKGLQAHKGFQ
ncbi:GDNF family receptor alpha-like [Ornithorhynchus anatinus]|uniref:GDNF family receptor alpha-like n=1 Tax=Ornithorhynchus anatinus TaxID=9258 RepID=UPI0019D4C848|nr:GDNF family receptor alpha-like [Ornithorhynchus anatinus]